MTDYLSMLHDEICSYCGIPFKVDQEDPEREFCSSYCEERYTEDYESAMIDLAYDTMRDDDRREE